MDIMGNEVSITARRHGLYLSAADLPAGRPLSYCRDLFSKAAYNEGIFRYIPVPRGSGVAGA
jgi:hypothetical protein